MPISRRALTTLVGLAALLAAGCRGDGAERGAARALPIAPARPRPVFSLTATDGTEFAFHERTRGRLTLLFFGYASCPDVCPVHLANIAAALDRLPPLDRERIDVVFVTTDPERDTPERIRGWLDAFDSTFVGLRGAAADVAAIQMGLGLRPAVAEPSEDGAWYAVAHAAQVLVVTPDDSVRALYPAGVRQRTWAADLPQLLEVR